MKNVTRVVRFPLEQRSDFSQETNERISELRRNTRKKKRQDAWQAISDTESATETEGLGTVPDPVKSSVREIEEMATVVERHGYDPEKFLRVLKQESEKYGVHVGEDFLPEYEGSRLPSEGVVLTRTESEWLRTVCCDVSDGRTNSNDDFVDQPYERLAELCTLLDEILSDGVRPVTAYL